MNKAVLNTALLNCADIGVADVGNVGAFDEGEVQPYIKGHITDGSSTFTFTVNGNESITVPVDSNGEWKWVVDRTVTSLVSAFESNLTIDKVVICGINTLTSGNKAFNGCKNIISCVFKSCDASLLTDARLMFQNMGLAYKNELILKLPKNFAPTLMERCFASYRPLNRESLDKSVFKNATSIEVVLGSAKIDIADLSEFYKKNYWYNYGFYFNGTEIPTLILGTINTNRKVDANFFGNCIENIIFKGTFNVSLELNLCSKLSEQSIVNIFNATAADNITLTFHQNVWNMIMREIDVQGSPIQVAYQNMIDNYDVTIANASFDAEIEYLEFSGTQYIDSGFKANTTTTRAETELQVTDFSVTCGLFGSRNSATSTNADSCNVFVLNNNRFRLDWVNGDINVQATNIVTTEKYVISITRGKATVNNVTFTGTNTDSIDQNYNFYIGEYNRAGSPSPNLFRGRFYWFKIYSNNQLVRDFIPVRKGTTGYLYDKVSGNLFGNSGTGDFILGNDK